MFYFVVGLSAVLKGGTQSSHLACVSCIVWFVLVILFAGICLKCYSIIFCDYLLYLYTDLSNVTS